MPVAVLQSPSFPLGRMKGWTGCSPNHSDLEKFSGVIDAFLWLGNESVTWGTEQRHSRPVTCAGTTVVPAAASATECQSGEQPWGPFVENDLSEVL